MLLGPLAAAQTDGTGGRTTGAVTLAEGPAVPELEQGRSPVEGAGRSPVEEAGHEEEGSEDEELRSSVEEGEEAAVALGAPPAGSGFPWLPVGPDGGGNNDPGRTDAAMSAEEGAALRRWGRTAGDEASGVNTNFLSCGEKI